MTDLKIAEGVVDLGDGTRLTLRLDHETLILAEEAACVPVKTLLQRLSSGWMGAMRAMVYAMLQPYHPDYDLKRTAVLLTHHAAALMPPMQDVLARAMPDAGDADDGGDAADPLPDAAAGGSSSSKRGAKRG